MIGGDLAGLVGNGEKNAGEAVLFFGVLGAEGKEVLEDQAAAADDVGVVFQLGQEVHGGFQIRPGQAAGFRAVGLLHGERGTAQAQFGEHFAHAFFVEDVFDSSCRGDLIERRLGDEDAALADEFGHLAEEEGEQEGADVGAVHVGVGHDDDFAVAELGDVEVVAPMPQERAWMMMRISSKPSILSRRAFSTLRILPLRGRMAW